MTYKTSSPILFRCTLHQLNDDAQLSAKLIAIRVSSELNVQTTLPLKALVCWGSVNNKQPFTVSLRGVHYKKINKKKRRFNKVICSMIFQRALTI